MKRHWQFTFILITLMIDAMGIGLIMPVMPDLIKEVDGVGLADAAIWGGLLTVSYAVMQFLFGPVVGNLSDRFGRRPVLLVSLFALAVDYLIMAVAGSILLLFVGRIFGGITSATHSTASAFVADISEPEKKAQNFGLVSAAFGIGFVMGPLIGGVLGAYFGPRAPFVAAAAIAGANFLFGYFVLPETVTDKIRRPFEWRRANPFGSLMSIGRLPGLKTLLIIYFLYQTAFWVYPAVWSYFGQERFGWSADVVGYSLALFGVSMALTQGLLIRLVIPKLGERKTVLMGLLLDCVVFIGTAFIISGWIVLALIPLSAVAAMAGPAMQGVMSRTADDNQQGELQGLLTSLNALSMIFSPLIMTQSFAYFIRDESPIYLPGAPFLLSAVMMLIAMLIFLTGYRRFAKVVI